MDWKDVLLVGGVVCCCGIPILGFVGFRFLGVSMLIPAIGGVWNVIEDMFGGGSDNDDSTSDAPRRRTRPTPNKPTQAKAQMTDFDQLVERYRQEKSSPTISSSAQSATPTDSGKSPYGVRDRNSSGLPGRTLRDKRYERNSGPSEVPQVSLDDTPDRNFLKRRRDRRSDYTDDEIFGGILDEDGDGYADS